MTKVLAGHDAPRFSLPAMNGQQFSLDEALKRGPAVLAFFKISCPVCQFAFPFLERLHQAYGNEQVTIWGISQDDPAATREFCAEYGLTFPALVDAEGYPVSNDYGLTNVPTVLLVAPDGKVKVSSVGFSKADIEKISAELAAHSGKPVAPPFRPQEAIPEYQPG